MGRSYITNAATEARAFSRAVIVEDPKKTLYLCGVVNRDANRQPVIESMEAATRAAFDRLRETVEAAGGTLADIVTMTVFLTDARWGDEFVRVRAEYFEAGHYPASALITVAGLSLPESRVEIQAIAVLD